MWRYYGLEKKVEIKSKLNEGLPERERFIAVNISENITLQASPFCLS